MSEIMKSIVKSSYMKLNPKKAKNEIEVCINIDIWAWFYVRQIREIVSNWSKHQSMFGNQLSSSRTINREYVRQCVYANVLLDWL